MTSISKKILKWFYGLFSVTITGVATSGISWLGMSAAKAAGVDVPSLNFKALGVLAAAGALGAVFPYLQKSPLPELGKEFDTEPPFPPAK